MTLQELLHTKSSQLTSVYFPAGYPKLESMPEVIAAIEESPLDFYELGIPFSDPLADGETIAKASAQALENGMNLELLFRQLSQVKGVKPRVLMGYFNPIFQYGIEAFLQACQETSVSAFIVPDLPFALAMEYKELYTKYQIYPIHMITMNSSEARYRELDAHSQNFIYVVSSAATTGAIAEFSEMQLKYFQSIHSLELKSPTMLGFGISNEIQMQHAFRHFSGAIVGSSFVNLLSVCATPQEALRQLCLQLGVIE